MGDFAQMALPLGSAAAALLACLAAVHFYWAFGGHRGLLSAIPVENGKLVFRPDPIGTAAIGFFLLVAALILLGRLGIFGAAEPRLLFEWGTWLVAALFFLRAVGDFHYVGFSKKVWETRFARLDTFIYSPLCGFIAAAAAAAALSPMP